MPSVTDPIQVVPGSRRGPFTSLEDLNEMSVLGGVLTSGRFRAPRAQGAPCAARCQGRQVPVAQEPAALDPLSEVTTAN